MTGPPVEGPNCRRPELVYQQLRGKACASKAVLFRVIGPNYKRPAGRVEWE